MSCRKNHKSSAAVKANRTRQMYRNLERAYGHVTMCVVRAKRSGDKQELSSLRRVHGLTTVAAILANLTRGTYNAAMGLAPVFCGLTFSF